MAHDDLEAIVPHCLAGLTLNVFEVMDGCSAVFIGLLILGKNPLFTP